MTAQCLRLLKRKQLCSEMSMAACNFALAAALAAAQSRRWGFFSKTRRRRLGVSSVHAAIQPVTAGGEKKTQISINNGSVPSGAPGEAESEPARAATPGTPVTLHPLIKEPVFLRRGYNVSCVQPVHYAPLLSSSCCRRVTHGCLFTTLQFLLLNHINVTVWRETKVKFSSKLSPCTKYKFLTFVLRFVPLKMIRFFIFHPKKKKKSKFYGPEFYFIFLNIGGAKYFSVGLGGCAITDEADRMLRSEAPL